LEVRAGGILAIENRRLDSEGDLIGQASDEDAIEG
jgi:hypothetical protein